MTAEDRLPSEYQAMWLFAMFDLPVDTKSARRRYVRFRNALLEQGFSMLQYSVYARYCPSEQAADVHKRRVRGILPSDGHVRLLAVTERQFGRMEVFVGKKRQDAEVPPYQLLLF